MKKLSLCILMFLFVLPFFGCSEKIPDKIETHIDASFTAKFGELNMEGLLIYTPEGQMYMDISTPDELYGLSYSWEESFTIGYRGLNAVTEADYLPDTSFAQAVKNTLDDIRATQITLEKTDGGVFMCKGKTASGFYIVYADQSGEILEITVPPLELKLVLEINKP